MWLADGWKDYQVIDCSKGEKLERWGEYLLVRPDPQVIWDTPKTHRGWKHMNGHYHRSAKGGGEWEFFDLPEQWTIGYNCRFDKSREWLQPFTRGVLKRWAQARDGRVFMVCPNFAVDCLETLYDIDYELVPWYRQAVEVRICSVPQRHADACFGACPCACAVSYWGGSS